MKKLVLAATVSLIGAGAAAQDVPADQAAFENAIVTARTAYDNAANDLAKGGQRPKRGKEICKAVQTLKVTDWVGTIDDLTTNSEGRGVLSVELGNEIWLKTWNNAFSDMGSNTLIDPESDLFLSLSEMSEGQEVVFSGSFLKDHSDGDCFEEQSMTIDGSMSEPEFIFVFSDIRPAL